MLRDQRHMSGQVVLNTPAEVEAFWEHTARRGFTRDDSTTRHHNLERSRTKVGAYVNGSRWVADCPRATDDWRCNGGIACWPDHDTGCCLSCGTVYPVEFPSAQMIYAAEQALAVRPAEARNWQANEGETAQDLRHDNIRRGFKPKAI